EHRDSPQEFRRHGRLPGRIASAPALFIARAHRAPPTDGFFDLAAFVAMPLGRAASPATPSGTARIHWSRPSFTAMATPAQGRGTGCKRSLTRSRPRGLDLQEKGVVTCTR